MWQIILIIISFIGVVLADFHGTRDPITKKITGAGYLIFFLALAGMIITLVTQVKNQDLVERLEKEPFRIQDEEIRFVLELNYPSIFRYEKNYDSLLLALTPKAFPVDSRATLDDLEFRFDFKRIDEPYLYTCARCRDPKSYLKYTSDQVQILHSAYRDESDFSKFWWDLDGKRLNVRIPRYNFKKLESEQEKNKNLSYEMFPNDWKYNLVVFIGNKRYSAFGKKMKYRGSQATIDFNITIDDLKEKDLKSGKAIL